MLSGQLVSEIKRLGKANSEGQATLTYGDLIAGTDSLFEALLGTLLSAKKHKVYIFKSRTIKLTSLASCRWSVLNRRPSFKATMMMPSLRS